MPTKKQVRDHSRLTLRGGPFRNTKSPKTMLNRPVNSHAYAKELVGLLTNHLKTPDGNSPTDGGLLSKNRASNVMAPTYSEVRPPVTNEYSSVFRITTLMSMKL